MEINALLEIQTAFQSSKNKVLDDKKQNAIIKFLGRAFTLEIGITENNEWLFTASYSISVITKDYAFGLILLLVKVWHNLSDKQKEEVLEIIKK